MNLSQTILLRDLTSATFQAVAELYAGGPGSGCNPDKGKCGRKPSSSTLIKGTVATRTFAGAKSKRTIIYSENGEELVRVKVTNDVLDLYSEDRKYATAKDGTVFVLWAIREGWEKKYGDAPVKPVIWREIIKEIKRQYPGAKYLAGERITGVRAEKKLRERWVLVDIASAAEILPILQAGGPGSGCNPEAAKKAGTKCGRPLTEEQESYREMDNLLRGIDPSRKAVRKPKLRLPPVAPQQNKAFRRPDPKPVVTGLEPTSKDNLAQNIASLKKRLKEKYYDADADKMRPVIRGRERKNLRQTLKIFKNELKEMKVTEKKEKKGLIPKDTAQITPKPAPKSVTKQSFTSSYGFNYTVLKAPGVRPEKGSARDLERRPHVGKGRFTEFVRTETLDKAGEALVYDWYRPGGELGSGTSVLIIRNFQKQRVTVHELGRGQHGFIERDTVVKFKNSGLASGFLNRRYGIRFSLTRSTSLSKPSAKRSAPKRKKESMERQADRLRRKWKGEK